MDKSTSKKDEKKDQPIEPVEKTVTPPPTPEPKPILIDLDVYCGGLNQNSSDKFAKTLLTSAINSKTISAGLKTREEWESIYLKLKFNT